MEDQTVASPRASFALPALAALLAASAVLQGGFHGAQLALLCASAIPLAVAWGVRPRGRVAAAFAVLGAALLASAAANGWPGAAVKPAATLALGIAAAALGASVTRDDGASAVHDVVVAVGLLVAAAGIAGVLWQRAPLAIDAGTWRLASTLTYQNAAGALLAIALVCALARATSTTWHRAASVVLAAALGATQSRGALLAFAAGIAVLAWARALERDVAIATGAGAMLATAAMVPSLLGARAAVPLAIAGLTAGVWVATARRARAVWRPMLALGALALMAAALAAPVRARFDASTTDRARVWSHTLAQMEGRWATGSGPGTYDLVAPKDRALVRTEFAHNEYLQALSETGGAGLAAVGAAIWLLGAPILRRARASRDAAAAAAAGAAFLVASAFDFAWRVPVVVAVALTAASAGFGSAVSPVSRSSFRQEAEPVRRMTPATEGGADA